jgi:hypothetical protein
MKTKSSQLQWLQHEIEKDKRDAEFEKLKFIEQIKKLKKEEIFPKKLSLWKRILRLFMG